MLRRPCDKRRKPLRRCSFWCRSSSCSLARTRSGRTWQPERAHKRPPRTRALARSGKPRGSPCGSDRIARSRLRLLDSSCSNSRSRRPVVLRSHKDRSLSWRSKNRNPTCRCHRDPRRPRPPANRRSRPPRRLVPRRHPSTRLRLPRSPSLRNLRSRPYRRGPRPRLHSNGCRPSCSHPRRRCFRPLRASCHRRSRP
jgi:hypothetical protein